MKQSNRLELTWIGKDNQPPQGAHFLVEDHNFSYNNTRQGAAEELTDNRLIYGDNLFALQALEPEFAGKIKCITIDPPYNTGSVFSHYGDSMEHGQWLSLMRNRLLLFYRLLHPQEGSLWVSIDDYEAPYLRIVLDEIFGRENFIAQNVWQKRYSRENRQAIGDVHEYVIVYARDPVRFKAIRNKVFPSSAQEKVYRNPNNDPRGRWRTIPLTAQEGHATAEQFYPVTTPAGKVFYPPKGRCWGISKATFEKLLAEGRIYFGKKGDAQPTMIRYLSEVDGYVPWTWWPHEEVGHTDEAKKEIHALFGKTDAFATPKPERLLRRILQIASNPGDWVLDSFAGSGTSGAVAHKMRRRWIMVERGEQCHTHIIPRLKKVIDGDDPGGITAAVQWSGGGGFRYFRLLQGPGT
ncbi:site-specific DNA-methyltransferase [Candidatus Magnetaquicoccus inordinatus]|uniref:site-specific DNA-methyltransferase n=1 Tax=Candidatus Magnetaquicoccus inordinatus TaxID=2496818 RepID=UPI00102C27A5|nr:site-specific DNA-methyltransferase [Candidatus Magnetaquicoccus inordinatus]